MDIIHSQCVRSASSRLRRSHIALALGLVLASPGVFAAPPAPGTALGGVITVRTAAAGEGNLTTDRTVARDANGDFVVVWESAQNSLPPVIDAQRYGSTGVPNGSVITVASSTTENEVSPSVAMDAEGDFVVAWSAGTTGNPYAISAQAYKADGTVNGAVLSVSANPGQSQLNPSVGMDAAGDFVVVWQGQTPTDTTYTIFAQPYNAAGVPGSLITVTPNPTNTESVPSVALDAAGDFVVAWQGYNATYTTFPAIFAMLYPADSTSGTAITVSGDPTNQEGRYVPSVAMDAAGDFVVAWQENVYVNSNLSIFNIYAQRYNAAGTVQGAVIPVTASASVPQTNPSVSLDALGDFVVAWQVGIPAIGLTTAAQPYSAAGVALAGGPIVFGNATQNPFGPSVALNADGDFVLAWGLSQYTPSDVYAQRYEGPEMIDLKSTLAASPSTVIAGAAFTLTYGLSNVSPAGTVTNLTINAAINQARAGAQMSLDLPTGVSFNPPQIGTNWTCPAPGGGVLTCTYSAAIQATNTAGALTLNFTAPSPSTTETLNFTATVTGPQPDPNSTNDSATAAVTVSAAGGSSGGGSSSGGSSSGGSSSGGGGALGFLSLALLGLPLLKKRRSS